MLGGSKHAAKEVSVDPLDKPEPPEFNTGTMCSDTAHILTAAQTRKRVRCRND
jgi:hypothetical protein